jgi:DNA-binding CsgD family transcriptional regulator
MATLEDIRQILAQIEARLERLEMHWLKRHYYGFVENGANGDVLLPEFTDAMRDAFVGDLTEREREAAKWACECLSNEAIGEQIGLSRGAVANLLTSVYDKLRATGAFGEREVSRAELVRFMGNFLANLLPGNNLK